MNQCCWCGQTVSPSLTISEVFSFSRLSTDVRCEKCTKKLLSIDPKKSCPGCSRMQESDKVCPDCLKWQKIYPNMEFHHTALYTYEGLIREWLEVYKFKGDYRLAHFFSGDIRKATRSFGRSFLIVPIPVSVQSLKIRGFNQVEGLLQAAEVPFVPVLEHAGEGRKQSEKNRKERMESVQPFHIQPDNQNKVRNKKVLIVDDVYTTGRTIFHARDVVGKAGAAQVRTLTLAR